MTDTIPGVLAATAAGPLADELALCTLDGRTITYRTLHEQVLGVAGALVARGIRPGDAVALWGPNSPEWAIAHHAVLAAGAWVVPLNTRYTAREAAEILERARCRAVFAAPDFLGRDYVAECASVWQRGPVLALAGALVGALAGPLDGAWRALVAEGAEHRDEVVARGAALRGSDISHLQFTSGTTGHPKGVMLRHGASVATSRVWASITGLGPADRYPVVAPFAHLGGHKTGLLTSAIVGACVIPVPVLRADALVEAIERLGASFLQGPPTMFHDLVAHHRAHPDTLGGVRVAVTGAAVVPPPLVRALREELGVHQVHTAYGLTESTGVVTMTAADDPIEVVATTVGRPLPGIGVRVVDPDGRDVGAGERGEVIVSGDGVMAGYLDDAAATATAVVDGWLHTGDVGVVGDDGNLRIVDRLTEMITVGGLNVYPAEVEHALAEHPRVYAVAVVAAPDDRLGEIPVAFVVPRGAAPDEQDAPIDAPSDAPVDDLVSDLVAWAHDRVAGFKMPRRFTVVDALPTNAAGKVAKAELRRWVADDPKGAGARS